MARSLLLVRHASIGDQYADQYVGSSDLPLSPKGCRQVEPLARWLDGRTGGGAIGRCFVSPQRRCRQTADLIAARCPGLSFHIDEDLREVDFGQWETLTFPQIAAGFPGRIKDWSEGGDDFVFPGGERRGDFRARVARTAARMAAAPADVVLAVAGLDTR